jgi:membrane protease YdiL (CAAX protease family)
MFYDYYLIPKIAISVLLVILFYDYIKSFVFLSAGRLALKLKLTRYYTFETSKGVVELPLIVLLHFIFCFFIFKLSHISIDQLGLAKLPSPILLFEGVLLGVGVMGASALLGRFYIELMRYFFPRKYPQDIKNWLAMARSGWIRHHFHTLEVLPVPIALLITLGQVCAEEIIFHGILINYFLSYGQLIALVVSTSLFMYMQIFHMPNRVCGAFPMIGALVMGVVGGVLYLQVHTLLPLIIAHITFFAVAVL